MYRRYYRFLMYTVLRISVALHKKIAPKDRLYAGSYIRTSENAQKSNFGEFTFQALG
jgi:hypothetical protein